MFIDKKLFYFILSPLHVGNSHTNSKYFTINMKMIHLKALECKTMTTTTTGYRKSKLNV